MKYGFITTKNAPDARKDFADQGKCVVWMHQVHGTDIAVIDESLYKEGIIEIPETDGIVTNLKNVVLTSGHGDCLPIYMYDPKHQAIGLAHSGWKGCLGAIGVNLINTMEDVYGTRPEDVECIIGPGIGYCCFEVDEDVMEAFTDAFPWAEGDYVIKKPHRKYNIDLKGIVSEYLAYEGIENIKTSSHCTCCEEGYWSYRRNKEMRRMLAWIEL